MSATATPERVAELAERTRAFVRDVCIPAEARFTGHDLPDELRGELQAAAKQAGIFAPHIPVELGGLGLDMRGWAVVFEEAGYSLLGPVALNCAAPDEGNMHLLELVATAEQKDRYLAPARRRRHPLLLRDDRAAPGAGSDPSRSPPPPSAPTAAGSSTGDKWFITGADGAAFAIWRAPREPGRRGATMFLVDADNPGITRRPRDPDASTRACSRAATSRSLRRLLRAGRRRPRRGRRGLPYAQVRLAPARLTHCMRWLGLARRALDVALDRAAERELFGAPLAELGMAQGLIADSVIDLDASRALIRSVAGCSTAGHARSPRVLRCQGVRLRGGVPRRRPRRCSCSVAIGVVHDLPVARFLREIRPFRIYDGPSETHRWAIARRASRVRARERGTAS